MCARLFSGFACPLFLGLGLCHLVVSIYRFAGLEKMYAGICKAMDEELRGVWN